jgi:hypothetical protein
MVLFLPAPDLAYRLSRERAPWIVNLPTDCDIVSCRLDARRGVVCVIRSQAFPPIAQGAVLPQFTPSFNGLRWRRSQ